MLENLSSGTLSCPAARRSSTLRGSAGAVNPKISRLIFVIILSHLITILGCQQNMDQPPPLPQQQDQTIAATNAPKEELSEQPLPANGYGKFFFKKSKTNSKLKLVPKLNTQTHMIVKLEDWDTGKVICWFFVREGKEVEIPIPAGNYRFKIASGEKWYGEDYLFGSAAHGASYSVITSVVNIPARTIYTIDLTPSVEGTLKDETLNATAF